MREYDQRLLQTVYWSLGTILAIVILLTGFAWFANFRIYERDKQTLSRELRATIEEEFNRYRARLEGSVQELRETTVKHMTEIVDARISPLRQRVLILTYQFAMEQAEDAERRGVLGNAVRFRMDVLEAGLELQFDWMIADSLGHILRLLEKGADLGGGRTSDLLTILERVPSRYSDLSGRIRQAIR